MSTHRAGFVHIIGKPNAGKSTLFNALVDHALSIATHKPQTTRHNIIGIDQGEEHQAIYVDTPGYLEPTYELQRAMMRNVKRALVDSDVLLWVVDIHHDENDPFLLRYAKKEGPAFVLLLNKVDTLEPPALADTLARWEQAFPETLCYPISALDKDQVGKLAKKITSLLPIHPPYYDKEVLTDKPTRFFVAEMVRKAIFLHYKKEIPYSCEVVTDRFEEKEHAVVIHVNIYVERLGQKRILIGHKGEAIKKVGIESRKSLEEFFKKKVFLSQIVKILPGWRDKKSSLAEWGYR
jgi:GTP-binding protein Era